MSVTEEKVGHVGDLQIGDTVRVHVDAWIRGNGKSEYNTEVKDKEVLGGYTLDDQYQRAYLVGDEVEATVYQDCYYEDCQEMTCDDGNAVVTLWREDC